MTSIYSIISIETSLVTHFSRYEIITLHWKGMLYVSNHDFSLFCLLKYYQILQKYLFSIGYSDMLNKLATIVYSLCFKKQTLELLLHLSFKAELPTNGLQDISFLVLKSIKSWKNCCEAIGPSLVIYVQIFFKFSHDKATFFYIV